MFGVADQALSEAVQSSLNRISLGSLAQLFCLLAQTVISEKCDEDERFRHLSPQPTNGISDLSRRGTFNKAHANSGNAFCVQRKDPRDRQRLGLFGAHAKASFAQHLGNDERNSFIKLSNSRKA